MGVVTKRSTMVFYSDPVSYRSHRVRIVLAEKGVAVDIIDVNNDEKPEDLTTLSPYNELPVLVDRDLVVYEANVMMEYLEERFPHPPLMPVYPVARAENRMYIQRIERDWGAQMNKVLLGDKKVADKARKELEESLISTSPIFEQKPFFMSDDFTLADCVAAPILWRLPYLGIELSDKKCKPLIEYAERVFDRESFQASLTDAERELRYPA